MSLFNQMISNLQNLGFYDFVLPFILFMAIIYGLLQNKKTISEETSINGIIAIALSFFITYVARGFFYTKVFGLFGVVMAAFLIIILFLAMFGLKPEELLGENKTTLAIILGVVAVIIFLSAGGTSFFRISNDTVSTIIMLLFVLLVLIFISKK